MRNPFKKRKTLVERYPKVTIHLFNNECDTLFSFKIPFVNMNEHFRSIKDQVTNGLLYKECTRVNIPNEFDINGGNCFAFDGDKYTAVTVEMKMVTQYN